MTSNLSEDTLISVFSFLKRKELTAVQLICQRLHKVVQENSRVIHIIESLSYYDSDILPEFDPGVCVAAQLNARYQCIRSPRSVSTGS
uniref:F-box domain-containing protein n=1 Tax=Ditylenchus dipsaci TaxID=166011 RepID=A0A915E4E0_9BILA